MKRAVWLSGALFLIFAILLGACQRPAAPAPKEPYKIGLTGAMTGPAAVSYIGQIEGFRIYVDKLNDEGGINGRRIELLLEDDRAEGARAGANIKKFAQAGAHMIIVASTSGVYPAVIPELKRANIPAIFMGIAPKEAMPPEPDPLIYSHIWGTWLASTVIIPHLIKEMGTQPVKLGIMGMDIPISRLGAGKMAEVAKDLGMEAVVKIVPLGTADLTPVASAFIDWGANAVTHWVPGALGLALFDALTKLGWKGSFVYAAPEPIEMAYERLKKYPNMVTGTMGVPMVFDLPQHREIKAAAEKYKAAQINTPLIWGWYTGREVEAALRQAGWPATTEKLVDALSHLEVDNRPLMPPAKWTPNDHVGPLPMRFYRWSTEKGRIEPIGPWLWIDPLGTKVEKGGEQIEIR